LDQMQKALHHRSSSTYSIMPRLFAVATFGILLCRCAAVATMHDTTPPKSRAMAMAVAVRQISLQGNLYVSKPKYPRLSAAYNKFAASENRHGMRRLIRHALHREGVSDSSIDLRLVDLLALYHDGHCMRLSNPALMGSLQNVSQPGSCVSILFGSSSRTPASGAEQGAFGAGKRRAANAHIRSFRRLVGLSPAQIASDSWNDKYFDIPLRAPRVYGHYLLQSGAAARYNSSSTLDWPTFKGLMGKLKKMNGFAQRESAYLKEHPLATDFDARFDLVVSRKDSKGMCKLVRDAVTFLGGAVVDEGGLSGFVPFYLHGQRTFDELIAEVFSVGNSETGWARFGGAYAQLSQTGYSALVRYNQPEEFVVFLQRTIDSLGLHVTEITGLKSFMPFFDGVCASQDFSTMSKELLNAAKNPIECGGGWLASRADIME